MRKYKGIHDPNLIADAKALGISDLALHSWDKSMEALRNKFGPRDPGLLLVTTD